MTRDQALTVRGGDLLEPHWTWNATEPHRKLSCPTEALEVRLERGCQTGVLIRVRFLNGDEADLDAGWFVANSVLGRMGQ